MAPTVSPPMPREKRDDVTVKIDAKVQHKAKMIAAYRNKPLAEYLTELLKSPVERDYEKLRKEMGQDG